MKQNRHFCDAGHVRLGINTHTFEPWVKQSQKIIMKELLLNDWTFFRVLRVVIGGVILIDGIVTGFALSIIIGGIFLYQGVFNVTCGACMGGNCQIPEKKVSSKE